MTHDDAVRLTLRLAGLFPALTDEQAKAWHAEFLSHEVVDVQPAMDRHRREQPEGWVRWNVLIETIANHRRSRLHADAQTLEEKYLGGVRKKQNLESKVREKNAEIDAFSASLSDEEFAALAGDYLSTLDEAARSVFAGKPLERLRRSATVRAGIFERMKVGGGALA